MRVPVGVCVTVLRRGIREMPSPPEELTRGASVFPWAPRTCPPPRWGRVRVGVSFPRPGGRDLYIPLPAPGEGAQTEPWHDNGKV
jgi:hypothetical protein